MSHTPASNVLCLRPASVRQRGTVMLLVMASLLLVLILGMTYLEIVRQDRRATNNLMRVADIDMVLQSVIDLSAGKLKDDLGIDSATGTFFKADNGDGTEYYDYPGEGDPWLASSEPMGATPEWSQASVLTTSTASGVIPAEDASTGAFVNANVNGDADGDGITDSKPEEAPLFSLRGRDYFMWVRIVDAAGMININTATAVSNSSGVYDNTNPPKFEYPTDIDFAGFLFARVGAAQTAELWNLLNYTVGTPKLPTTTPTPLDSPADYNRVDFWLNGARYYGAYPALYKKLGIDTELELRYRNGLNDKSIESPIETAGMMPTALANAGTTETSWQKALTNMSIASTPIPTGIANYFRYEPRHNMTTVSKTAVHAPSLAADTTRHWKLDINRRFVDGVDGLETGVTGLREQIFAVYSENPPTTFPPNIADAAEFSDQLAANIIDYADDDNLLTEHNGRYGMEALPFITEAYAHIAYKVTAATPTGNPNEWSCTLTAEPTAAYAIELRNPTRGPILLSDIQLVVDGVVWGTLDTLAASAVGLPGDGKLPPDRPLILYRNSTDGKDMTAQFDLGQTPITKDITNAWPVHPFGTTNFTIALQVKDTNDVWVTYQKLNQTKFNSSFTGPRTITSTSNPLGPPSTFFHQQSFAIGNGNGINMMTVTEADIVVDKRVIAFETSFFAGDDRLGTADKTTGGGPANKVAAPNQNQLIISDSGAITHIGELAHIAAIGPTSTQTVAEVWGAADGIARFIPDMTSAQVMGTGNTALPHAIVLAERFTTMSPAEDGIDNDGDGDFDEPDELAVPGLINFNTASKDLLYAAIPIPDATQRTNIVDAMVDYREAVASTRPATHRTAKGLAHIGELYNLTEQVTMDVGTNQDGSDPENLMVGGIQVDFLANPDAGTPDGIIDDIEERSMLLRWLSQIATTRSDVYIAYVLVRGYPAGTTTGALSEKRAIVIFDRSEITTDDDAVKVLGIYTY